MRSAIRTKGHIDLNDVLFYIEVFLVPIWGSTNDDLWNRGDKPK